MEHLAHRIRSERKRLGLALNELTEKVSIRPLRPQKIQTVKSSPSVALLISPMIKHFCRNTHADSSAQRRMKIIYDDAIFVVGYTMIRTEERTR